MASIGLNGTIVQEDGTFIEISGYNRPRLTDELIIYTPTMEQIHVPIYME